MSDTVQIRALCESDPETISRAFRTIGWGKPVAQYQRYLAEQEAGSRTCQVATVAGQFAGYVTVNWNPAIFRVCRTGYSRDSRSKRDS